MKTGHDENGVPLVSHVSQTFSNASIKQCSESFETSVKNRPFMFSFLLWEFNFTSDQGRMVEKCKWPGHKNQTFKAPALINDIFMEMSPQNYNNKKGHVLHVMLSFEFLFLVVDKWPISGRSSEADQLRLFWESGWNNLSTCFLVNHHSELSISSGLDCPKQSWLKWTVLKKSISLSDWYYNIKHTSQKEEIHRTQKYDTYDLFISIFSTAKYDDTHTLKMKLKLILWHFWAH